MCLRTSEAFFEGIPFTTYMSSKSAPLSDRTPETDICPWCSILICQNLNFSPGSSKQDEEAKGAISVPLELIKICAVLNFLHGSALCQWHRHAGLAGRRYFFWGPWNNSWLPPSWCQGCLEWIEGFSSMNISQENFLTTDSPHRFLAQRCTRQQEPEMNTTNGMDVGLKIQVLFSNLGLKAAVSHFQVQLLYASLNPIHP